MYIKPLVKLISVTIIVLAFVGEARCIYKAINCNWNPVGKAEVVYTAAALTGLGAFVGWIDIKDN